MLLANEGFVNDTFVNIVTDVAMFALGHTAGHCIGSNFGCRAFFAKGHVREYVKD